MFYVLLLLVSFNDRSLFKIKKKNNNNNNIQIRIFTALRIGIIIYFNNYNII